jgi:hypothetical protein
MNDDDLLLPPQKEYWELYKERRKTWKISPVTRIKKSKKKFNRNKEKEEFRNTINESFD